MKDPPDKINAKHTSAVSGMITVQVVHFRITTLMYIKW